MSSNIKEFIIKTFFVSGIVFIVALFMMVLRHLEFGQPRLNYGDMVIIAVLSVSIYSHLKLNIWTSW